MKDKEEAENTPDRSSRSVASNGTVTSIFRQSWELILREIRDVLSAVDVDQAEAFVTALLSAEKAFFVGVGRVGLALQTVVKRLNHLGLQAWYVGDLAEPAITERDLLVVASASGESVVPRAVAEVAKRFGAKIAHIGSNPSSSLRSLTDIFVRIPANTRLARDGEIESRQIMTSLFEQALLVFGDAVALAVVTRRAITDLGQLWTRHANLE